MLRRGFYMKKDSRSGVMLLSPMPFVSLALQDPYYAMLEDRLA